MKRNLQISLLIVLFLLPIILYTYKFGFGLWEEHHSWAELGTYFSGIYSPLVALLAFLILAQQSKSQYQMDKYHCDQAYIQEARKDLDFYLNKIEHDLNTVTESGATALDELILLSQEINEDNARSSRIRSKVTTLRSNCRLAFDLWTAIGPILAGLSANKEPHYTHALQSSKHRIVAILSNSACIALDKCFFSLNLKLERHRLFFWLSDETQI
ncbi:hypothetical protein RJ43_05490 [Alteromonas macleodii]|uniref:hypothetical protein n=1 Tax=Alteromonas macleodii TaxID=28108 RepID=UPI00057CF0E1|nr:hypothetical protein [Alteromonas macleodii]KHT56355.1 hypothetical protein RJ43_05490 [Alteromonas macleodii]